MRQSPIWEEDQISDSYVTADEIRSFFQLGRSFCYKLLSTSCEVIKSIEIHIPRLTIACMKKERSRYI